MQSNETQLIIATFNRIYRRRKWLVVLCVVLVLIPIILYNETADPIYQADTMVVFEEFSNSVDSYQFDFSKEAFFNNQLEELGSFSFSEDILSALPAEYKDRFSLPDDPPPGFNQTEYLVTNIQKNLTALPVKGSNIIKIGFKSSDPDLCMVVANTAAQVLRDRNFEIKKEGVGGEREFISRQLQRYKSALDSAENALRIFKERHQLTSIDREAEELMRRMTEAEVSLTEVKTQRGAAENKLGTLRHRLAEHREGLDLSVTDIGSPWAQVLRDRLVELNNQFLNLKAQGYPDDHPKLRDIRTNINKVKNELKEKARELILTETASNPIAQIEKYVDETVALQIEIESLKAQERELMRALSGYQERLGEMPDKEYTLARLQREKNVNERIYLMLLERLEQAKISESKQSDNIRIIDRAHLPKKPISPNKTLNLTIGILLGLLIGIAASFIIEVRNATVDTPEDIERVAQLPVIGTIPNINVFSKGKFKHSNIFQKEGDQRNERIYRALISSLEPNTVIAEAYRMLRSNMQFLGVGKKYKTVLATSLGPGDGKTTTLSNLAIAFASFGHKTLLIDSDLRIPQIHNFFGTEREGGVTDLLEALNELDEFVANPTTKDSGRRNGSAEGDGSSKAVLELRNQEDQLKELQTLFRTANRSTGIKNLNFMPSGTKVEFPKNFVSTGPMPIILQKFYNRFNVILIDSAPLLLVDDTLMLASIVDAVILVIHPNKYDQEMLLKAKRMLENANANLIGIVFNNFEVQGQYKKYYAEYTDKVS